MELKNQKAIEAKVHSQLHRNVSLLTHLYTPTKEFCAVFQQDMFVKNNSAGFQQVVYYLLNVLDCRTFKEKVRSWPIYDSRSETQFRGEIVRYLNELNGIYEDAGLPSILMSNIIAPGGLRFAKYMLKLSQLVLYEHLRSRGSLGVSLHRIHHSTNMTKTEGCFFNAKVLTDHLNEKTRNAICDNSLKLEEYKNEGTRITEEIRVNIERVSELEQKLAILRLNISRSDNNLDTKQEMLRLKQKITSIQNLNEKFEKAICLMNSLLKDDFIFTYKPGMYPSEVIEPSPEINLLHLIEKTNQLLQTKPYQLNKITQPELKCNIKKFEAINGILQKHVHKLKTIDENLSKMSSQLEAIESECNLRPGTLSSEEILAAPLESLTNSSLGILNIDD